VLLNFIKILEHTTISEHAAFNSDFLHKPMCGCDFTDVHGALTRITKKVWE
jgi:hypothetical protein